MEGIFRGNKHFYYRTICKELEGFSVTFTEKTKLVKEETTKAITIQI